MIVGGSFAWNACNYPVGNSAHMGPGYFPLILGVLLAILGAAIVIQSIAFKVDAACSTVGSIAWKPLLFVIGANFVFGLMLTGIPAIGLPPLGLVAGIYALVLISAFAGDEFRLREVLILATALAVFSYWAFIVLLNLPFQAWPTFK